MRSHPEDRKRETLTEDRVLGGRPSARSGLRHSTAALEATMPALIGRVGLCQSCDFPALLRQRDPEGLPETRWTENRPGNKRTAHQPGLAYIPTYLSVPARRDAACAAIEHHERIWQRADGFQARGQQQSGKPTAQNSKGTGTVEAMKKAPSDQRLRKTSSQPLERPLIVGLCGVENP